MCDDGVHSVFAHVNDPKNKICIAIGAKLRGRLRIGQHPIVLKLPSIRQLTPKGAPRQTAILRAQN